MKKILLNALLITVVLVAPRTQAQNTFPATGNVGIGTTTPTQLLYVNGGNIQTTGAVYANSWFRSYGNTGWYSQTYGGGWHMTDTNWVRSYNNKSVLVTKVVRADGGFSSGANTVIDAGGGWHRTYGATGWVNQTYAGGWYMADATWIRTYNNKAVYSSNTIRTDGELQAGPSGNRLLVTAAGLVKIGNVTTPAGYKLYVETGILTEKVKIALKTSADWADHVFNKNYPLMPLNEVEAFVKKNGHLPGVPSAGELVNEGIDLGKMDAKLMEKIEELTLYTIQLKKEINRLQEKISVLENNSTNKNP